MKKLLAMLLIFSMTLALFASCDNNDFSSSSEEETSEQSSTQGEEGNTDEPAAEYVAPYLAEKKYYTTIAHGEFDFGTSAKEGNHFNYKIFKNYKDYTSSLSATVAPIADEELFEDNIVIYIDNPNYYREIKDLKIGFRDFNYSHGKIEITIDAFPCENVNFDNYDGPFVSSTYVVIPKAELASYSISYEAELDIETNRIGEEYVTYSVAQEGKPISFYEDEKLWLIRNAEEYDAFIREECDVFNGASGKPYYHLPGIIHYSPHKYQNSFLQTYENIHIHEDGTVYMEYHRLFNEEREEPDSYEAVYTYVSLENSKIDLSRANGKVVCEDYDYIVSQDVITAASEPQAESKYYKEVILAGGITSYNPPGGYVDGYYNMFYLFRTLEELREFGFMNLEYYGINVNDYCYLISSRSYYNREYADIGFSNLRIEDGVAKIDLYQGSVEPNGETENLSLILIPKAELPNGIASDDIQINYVTEKCLDELAYVSHIGKTDKAEIGSAYIYTNLGAFLAKNGEYSGNYLSREPETSPLATDISFDNVNADFFEENIIVSVERQKSRLGHQFLGYKDARIVDGVLVITAIFAYNDSDERWEALIDETWWDDQIVIPRAMLGNAEINGNTLVRVELEIKHCIYEAQELIQDACE